MRSCYAAVVVLTLAPGARADDGDSLRRLLEFPVLTPRTTLLETQEFLDGRVPRLPEPTTAAAWEKEVERLRAAVLEKVVFRGAAAGWRDRKPTVVMGERIACDGYTIQKVRYEVVPGFWASGVLYIPAGLAADARVPVMLALNGHDRAGTAARYKQLLCINLVRRGMIVFNAEWVGMGQLAAPGNHHGAMNQLDLCGTSGLSVFYLSMTRGLDLLLAHPNADPRRVSVSGLSGGGWQTVFVSALDPRVTLANPVAGYSSFLTRVRHFKDLGDSEQTPADLATLVDYTHLTAMRAPRPTLLTYNAKDNCCFEAGYALPPLVRGAEPFFKLHNAGAALRSHVNDDPGDHNFEKDNREALYRMIGDHFYPGDKDYPRAELATADVQATAALAVELPPDNLTLNGLARRLAADLPRGTTRPKGDKAALTDWQASRRAELARLIRFPDLKQAASTREKNDERGPYRAEYRHLKAGPWVVPMVCVEKGTPARTAVVLCDKGRAASGPQVDALVRDGYRVVVADVFSLGECRPPSHDWLWGLMLATVGERPLGLMTAQLDAVVRSTAAVSPDRLGVKLVAIGPRSGTVALAAAALNPGGVASLELHEPPGSFKEVIEQNQPVQTAPERFTFGLLARFDAADVAALVAPRPVVLRSASDRARAEFGTLAGWYAALGSEFTPGK
ncbi:MAG TPA: hypothetical protein VH092_34405 [Urbifossiella sp.]|jgi:hypothetical protein|nr:hypothetical protein [Urbifossiella sp.]